MDSKNRLEHIIHCLVEYRKLWLLPAIAGLVLSTFYAFFIQGETWTSRQSMIIRDDLLGQTFKPGSFISEEAMKSAQETVLETARRPEVIRKTLEKLGPDTKSFMGFGGISKNWPSDQVIEDFRGSVSFESANGGEFGKSEVIVLAVKGSSPKRSVDFLSILLDEVDVKLSEIQGDRFESMESELRATRDSTKRSKEALEMELVEMESGFEGTDIHLVRNLSERAGGSPSAFENKLNEIAAQRRAAEHQLNELRSNRRFLIEARKNSINELPTSAELLTSQPALSEMVTGLAKAKQDLAQLESNKQPDHPDVESGRANVDSIQRQIRESLGTIVRGLESQIAIQEQRLAIYDELFEKNTRRLSNVSKKRAPYAALAREVEKLNEDYSEASARLTRMKSRKMASASIKLLTRIGEPSIGTRADGMGKRSLSMIGGIAGLMIGMGMVMLVAPPFTDPEMLPSREENPPTTSEERLAMQQFGGILPRRRDNEMVAQHDEAAFEPNTQESEIVVERETVPQRQPEPQPVTTPPETAPAQQSFSEISQTIPPATAEVSEPAIEPQVSAAPQPLPAQIPPIVVIPNTTETIQPNPESAPSPVDPPQANQTVVSHNETQAIPPKRPGAKTLAAIFANMPQPKTDLVEPASGEVPILPNVESGDAIADKIADLTSGTGASSTPEAPIAREPSQTIPLKGDLTKSALPLQRRSSARPVDLAKTDPGTTGQQSIDNVFSQLTPPKQLPRETVESDVND